MITRRRFAEATFLLMSLAMFVRAVDAAPSGAVQRVAAPHAGAPAAKFHRGWMARNANSNHAWLYVDSEQNSVIAIYDLEAPGIPQIGEITDGLTNPTGMAIDAAGTLYVSNYYGASISIYPAGATEPASTLTQGITVPNGLAIDASGDLYVANKASTEDGMKWGAAQASILVFPPGQTTPSQVMTNSLIQNPGQLFFDVAGNLYLGDSNTGISEFPAGSQQPMALNLQGLATFFGSVAVDPLDGNLYVGGTPKRRPFVLTYLPGTTAPDSGLKTRAFADFLAFGDIRRKEYLFVPDGKTSAVYLFVHGSKKPKATLQTVPLARGVAYKPAGVP